MVTSRDERVHRYLQLIVHYQERILVSAKYLLNLSAFTRAEQALTRQQFITDKAISP